MMNIGLDEGEEESDDENTGGDEENKVSKFEAVAPFKDLYPQSEIIKVMREYG